MTKFDTRSGGFFYLVYMIRAASPCRASGCRALVTDGSGYCIKHSVRKEARPRESSSKRGYGYAWQKARAGYLKSHPLCVECQKNNIVELATDVDHIKPHGGDQDLFWDKNNWQALCHSHHSHKTASEDGGFGNSRRGGLG